MTVREIKAVTLIQILTCREIQGGGISASMCARGIRSRGGRDDCKDSSDTGGKLAKHIDKERERDGKQDKET